jgi:hypothetical protein
VRGRCTLLGGVRRENLSLELAVGPESGSLGRVQADDDVEAVQDVMIESVTFAAVGDLKEEVSRFTI